jgi:hypothetical protein
MIHHSENPRREISNGEAGVVGAVLGFGLVALALYLAVARFHIRNARQDIGRKNLPGLSARVPSPTASRSQL